jgi:DNA polymerase elongation subunit (family B)
MKGWIIDCYPDYEHDCIVIWIKTNNGIERLVDRCFFPKFYVWAPEERLVKLTDDLTMFDVKELTLEKKKIWLGEEKKLTLGVTVNKYGSLNQLARMVSRWGDYRDYSLFNVDMRFEQRYFLAYDLFPMGLIEFGKELRSIDSPYRLDYPIPNLRTSNLKVDVKARNGIPTFDDPIGSVHLDKTTIDGPEESILTDLDSIVREIDPDVIYTYDGDGFYMHYLAKRAERNGLRFDLGRESGGRFSKGKSYFTYGRILYKPPAHKLRGRIHIDTSSSFMFAESGIYGLIDLSRLCGIPVQDLSRLSPGSAISAMQVNEALRTGHLVLWKKNLPERFKTARELIVCDRGGFIYEPAVGIHDNIVEVDFASLYPSIMVRYNISPETVMCDCCPDSSRIVPEIGYRICEKRTGLIPRVLDPIIKRRLAFKRLMKGDNRRREIYEQRSKILKWVLVTCFGYTGYRNARFGRIECHESITAYGREILLRTSEIAERHGFRIIHGIVDSLWLGGDADPTTFCKEATEATGIHLQIEGKYKWIVFLPTITTDVGALNRYYGIFDTGEIKVRGIALRKNDTPPLIRDLQTDMLKVLSKAENSEEFEMTIPSVLEVTERYVRDLFDGKTPLEELVITKRVSKELGEYRQWNDSVAALKQLSHKGFDIQPGEVVEYVICDAGSHSASERVKVAQFLRGDESYDADKYVEQVLRATTDLLSPFGCDFGTLRGRMTSKVAESIHLSALAHQPFTRPGMQERLVRARRRR